METKTAITALNTNVKELTAIKTDLDSRIIAGINALGMDQIRNDQGTFSLSKSVVPSEIDWEIFHQWILDNNMLHLLQRRVSGKEYSDMVAMGENIPGITPFDKVTLKTLKRK